MIKRKNRFLAAKRRAGTAPCVQTALQNVDLLAAHTAQQGRSHAGALAVFVNEQDGLGLVELVKFVMNAVSRNIDRAGDAFLLEFARVAQVNDLGALVIDEIGGRGVVEFRKAAAIDVGELPTSPRRPE